MFRKLYMVEENRSIRWDLHIATGKNLNYHVRKFYMVDMVEENWSIWWDRYVAILFSFMQILSSMKREILST